MMGVGLLVRLRRASPKTKAYWAIVGSVLGFAFVPLMIEATATDSNPFYFNAFATVAQTFTLIMYLHVYSSKTFTGSKRTRDPILQLVNHADQADTSEGIRLRRIRLIFRLFVLEGSRALRSEMGKDEKARFVPRVRTFGWMALPLIWLVLSRLEYAFFAWSADYIDAAVTATLFRLWPLLMIFILARYGTQLRSLQLSGEATKYHITGYKTFLMSLTLVGAVFVIMSQSDGPSILAGVRSTAGLGIVLALVGAAFAGISPAASLIFGDQLHRIYQQSTQSELPASMTEAMNSNLQIQRDRDCRGVDGKERLERMWFSVLGHAISGIAIVPLNLVMGAVFGGYPAGLSFRAAIGGLVVGSLLSGVGVLLLRVANTLTTDLGVNSVFYSMPLLSLLLLAAAGIVIPRMDLFLIGTTLVLALTILIEADPDQSSDPDPFDKAEYGRSRWGFSSLVLALWLFGTIVYLRDEWFPEIWLQWSLPDYWGLVALSATVFALIFGFRVARLSSRISHEDETMLRLFRQCRELVDTSPLQPNILQSLRELDVARPKELRERYHLVRSEIVAAKRKLHPQLRDLKDEDHLQERDDVKASPELVSVMSDDTRIRTIYEKLVAQEVALDSLAHSKQQGRDFSELMSLTFFALITIALGLMARPTGLAVVESGWSGFLAEAFAVFFVATIAFLAVNLFDIRKDREFQLIEFVGAKDVDIDYSLHFRYKPDLSVQRRVSVLVCAGVCSSIVYLLYDKWLLS